MSAFAFNSFAAITIFLMAFIAGLLPLQLMQRHRTTLELGDAWASGIFLGAALFHMLPDSERSFHSVYPHLQYPLSALFLIVGFLLLLIIERIVIELTETEDDKFSHITGILLFVVLSIHALIEGSAVGINTIVTTAFVIYIAIMAHKGSASFALAINLHRAKLSNQSILLLIFLFSLMSPIGIGLGLMTTKILHGNTAKVAQGIFNALAAGTFLYIGMRHLMEKQFAEYPHGNPISEFMAILLGIALMGIVAIWV